MTRSRIAGCALGIVASCALLAAPSALATFHLMKIREVYAGSSLAPEAKYVELQMFAGGQNHVKGHSLRTYNASGGLVGTSTFAADVTNGANQSTILLATAAAESQFGLVADAPLASPSGLSAAGGAVCWEELDCVSWGSFAGALPGAAGTPATAIPDGTALRRTIAPGCATLLEGSDDSNDSATDFAVASPAPRPNATPPSELACASGGNGGSGSPTGSGGAPQTTLRGKPPKRTADRTPTFRFAADETGVRFQCKLDRKPFRGCRSPFTTKRLSLGAHSFRVRAVDSDGKADPTPALWRFRVIRGA
jgi:hypothetical protein